MAHVGGTASIALVMMAACGGSVALDESSGAGTTAPDAEVPADGSVHVLVDAQDSGRTASETGVEVSVAGDCTASLEFVRTYGGVECPDHYDAAFTCVYNPGQVGGGRRKVCSQVKVVVVTGGYFLKGCVYGDTEKLVYAYMGASATEFCNRSATYLESPRPDRSPDASSDCSYCTFMGFGCEGYQEIPCVGGEARSDADAQQNVGAEPSPDAASD
jgi:hypothetical protein